MQCKFHISNYSLTVQAEIHQEQNYITLQTFTFLKFARRKTVIRGEPVALAPNAANRGCKFLDLFHYLQHNKTCLHIGDDICSKKAINIILITELGESQHWCITSSQNNRPIIIKLMGHKNGYTTDSMLGQINQILS